MLVKDFMIPADKTLCCAPFTTIEDALNALLQRRIGCLIVVTNAEAVGIVTKSDLLKAYLRNASRNDAVSTIMSTNLITTDISTSRDILASIYSSHKIHHIIVTDCAKKFCGITSSWDLVKEVALDANAWPYFRTN